MAVHRRAKRDAIKFYRPSVRNSLIGHGAEKTTSPLYRSIGANRDAMHKKETQRCPPNTLTDGDNVTPMITVETLINHLLPPNKTVKIDWDKKYCRVNSNRHFVNKCFIRAQSNFQTFLSFPS